jgi:hypothetical protein
VSVITLAIPRLLFRCCCRSPAPNRPAPSFFFLLRKLHRHPRAVAFSASSAHPAPPCTTLNAIHRRVCKRHHWGRPATQGPVLRRGALPNDPNRRPSAAVPPAGAALQVDHRGGVRRTCWRGVCVCVWGGRRALNGARICVCCRDRKMVCAAQPPQCARVLRAPRTKPP